ncbi:proline--tRNA ligase [Orientia chuto str. Dubai]|uniref:Proline--tRNA ligase n=1 Tax=Orientia chuto str. Dubai TaxID=1359168 RepID=A0A0F3MJB5_9RICK|nr:proline--tRNA ligase [Candidatus Orientia mediorientalis]KJV55868.1 proline--tRNA ligase [Orientia chuto str. Dubai]
MRLSQYFLPLLKEDPAGAEIISHKLMLRAGMLKQACTGIYNWLPLGIKVLHKIQGIIRKNMDAAQCIELLMPCIQPASLWKESFRYDAYGKEMLKIKDRHDNDLIFGPTNEELITDIFRSYIQSYKDLPKNFYHIQWKFRDEIRPRFGTLRSREFLMKDAYSFDIDQASAIQSYNLMYLTYLKIFKDLGLNVIPVQADNGAIGGKLSHEFHIITATGDNKIYYDSTKFDPFDYNQDLSLDRLEQLYIVAEDKHRINQNHILADKISIVSGIEVGHIFYFGTKYSELMNACIQIQNGKLKAVEMGSYGIGISRLIGAIIEANHDQYGIVWPQNIAPFNVSIINLLPNNDKCAKVANQLYQILIQQNIESLLDDTSNSAGYKLATHDLIGIPYQIIIGKNFTETAIIELKYRHNCQIQQLSIDVLINQLTEILKQ